MAATKKVTLINELAATATITGDWVKLSDAVQECFIVVKAGARTAGTYTAVIQTSTENGTTNAPIEIVGALVLDGSNLIRVSDQTSKRFAQYARAVLTSSSADFDDVEVYLQY